MEVQSACFELRGGEGDRVEEKGQTHPQQKSMAMLAPVRGLSEHED